MKLLGRSYKYRPSRTEMRLNLQFIQQSQKALRTNNVTVDLSSVFPVSHEFEAAENFFGQQQHTGIGERGLNWAEGFTFRVAKYRMLLSQHLAIF